MVIPVMHSLQIFIWRREKISSLAHKLCTPVTKGTNLLVITNPYCYFMYFVLCDYQRWNQVTCTNLKQASGRLSKKSHKEIVCEQRILKPGYKTSTAPFHDAPYRRHHR